jgi:hypothetical protein
VRIPKEFIMSMLLFAVVLVLTIASFAPDCYSAQYFVAQQNPEASDENPGTLAKPFRTIGKAISAVREGDSIVVHKGIYREEIKMPEGKLQSPISIEAASRVGEEDGEYEEVVISGADIISNWERYQGEDMPQDANIWTHSPWSHVWIGWKDDMSHGAPPPVGRSEQVIVDDTLLKPVLSIEEMKPGTFFADPKETKALYVRLENDDSPDRHTIEASVRDTLLSAPDHARVRGLIFRYAANRAQHGAIRVSGQQVLVEDCLVEWTNGSGIRIGGENFILRRVTSRNNGQLGLGGSGRNFLMEECIFQNNNVKGFSSGWEAGGFKIVRSWGAKIERCKAVGNHGPGMWFDIDNFGGEVRQCYCVDNDRSGIFIEISRDFLITDNLCVNNGGVGKGDWAGAGISIGESRDCYVAFNTCVDNQYGISVRGQIPREVGETIYKDRNITIRNNILAYNRTAQFGLMWDQPFMGRHSSQRDLSEEEWQKHLQDAVDPDDVGLMLDYNLYAPAEEAEIARWGVSWRPKWKPYTDLDVFASERGLERHGELAEPRFVSWRERDFRLMPESPAISSRVAECEEFGADGYIRYGMRYPALGMKQVVR